MPWTVRPQEHTILALFLAHQSGALPITSLQIHQYRYFLCQEGIFHQVRLTLFLKGNEVERFCCILADATTKTHLMGK